MIIFFKDTNLDSEKPMLHLISFCICTLYIRYFKLNYYSNSDCLVSLCRDAYLYKSNFILRGSRGEVSEHAFHPWKHSLLVYNTIHYMSKMNLMSQCNWNPKLP